MPTSDIFLDSTYLINLILLIINLAIVLILYYKSRKFREKERTFDKTYCKIVEDAHKEAAQIIKETSKKSKALLLESEDIKKESQEEIEKNLKSFSEHNKNLLKKRFESFQQENLEFLDQLKEDLKENSQKNLTQATQKGITQVEEFFNDLKNKTLLAQEEVEKEINQRFGESLKAIAAHQKDRLEEVDQSIEKIVYLAVKKVISESISIDIHEKLILEALEKAKRESVFAHE